MINTSSQEHVNVSMTLRRRKENFALRLISLLLPNPPPFSHTPWKICVGVGCSWALYDGVGVWPVAGAEEKWLGTEYGKGCYNSSYTAHHSTACVRETKESTDLRRGRRQEKTIHDIARKIFFLQRSNEFRSQH